LIPPRRNLSTKSTTLTASPIEAPVLIRTVQLLALSFALLLLPAHAGDKVATDDVTGAWTLIIPEAFAGIVFSWRINADGNKMKLSQEGIPYAFEGARTGPSLTGTLYLNGKSVSRFCALKGDTPPDRCDQSVASR
jgi:hypothetical protein